MIIILISFAFLIIGGLGWLIAERRHKYWEELQRKYREAGYKYSHSSPERKGLEESEERCRVTRNRWGRASAILFGAFIIGIAAVFICCLVMMNQCMATAERVELEETYIALHQNRVIGIEHNEPASCDALTKQIEYNTAIRNGRRYNSNPWISWFVPDFYDELPLFSSCLDHPAADPSTNDLVSYPINQYDFITPNQ